MRLEARTIMLSLVGPSIEFEAHCKCKGKQGVGTEQEVTGPDLYLKDSQDAVWRMIYTGARQTSGQETDQ